MRFRGLSALTIRTAVFLLLFPISLFAQIGGARTPPAAAPRPPRTGDPWRMETPHGVRQAVIPFEAEGGEKIEFRFAVSRPGTISINAKWNGAPIVVRLAGPVGQPMIKRGDRGVKLRSRATSDGIAKSTLWTLTFEPEGANVSGTFEIHHPASVGNEVQALYDQFAAEQSDARIRSLETLATEIRKEFEQHRASFQDRSRELRVLRCPQWNLTSEAKIEAKTLLDGFNCSGSGISMFGMTRYGGPYSTMCGDDSYFPSFELKNGWSVDAVFFRAIVSRDGEAGARLVRSQSDGESPSIRVRWWATPDDSVHYVLLVAIAGPAGTPHE